MPRGERPLDGEDSQLVRFAADLRRLRQKAGGPTYRVLAGRAHYSVATLSEAAGGRKLPSLAVTLAFVRACDGDVDEWERRWHEVAADLAAADTAIGSGDARAPYVGLAAFQLADAGRFFGRERFVADLVSMLARQRFVAVFGASGAGKSSLLRAGLLAGWHGPAVLFTPGSHPVEECAITLARLTGGPPGAVHTELLGDRRNLHRLVRQTTTADLVLIVDQFEELFTLCHDPAERAAFIDMLLAAVQADNSRCRVVLGVRADFYTHCTNHPELVDALNGAQLTMGPMTTDELRLAISQPAVRSGYAVETALLTELIVRTSGQAGILPLLSHALLEAWRRRRGNTVTLAGFHAAGGIDGALAQTAESVFTRLSAQQQPVAKGLMLRMTALGDGTEDTKRQVTWAELDDDPDTRVVLDRLIQARLVAVDRDVVEVCHEALIRAWPRLRDWLADDREGLRLHRELTEATDAWQSLDRDHGALYRGVRLAKAKEWAVRHGGALTSRERAFLDASVAARQAEDQLARLRSRRLRQAVAALSALLVLAATATTYAVTAQRTAARQRNTALSQTVASKAATLSRTDPALAAQLSLAAYRLAPTTEAQQSLLAVFPFPYPRRLSGHTGNVNSVAFSRDGRVVVTTSHDRTARLWNVANLAHPEAAANLAGHTATVNAAAFGPGRVLATASWDHTAKLWDATDPGHPVELATLGSHADHVNDVAFSADGRTAATVSTDRTARLWDVADPRRPRELATLTGHASVVVGAAFRPDGRVLATASFDRTIRLWDLANPGRPTILTGHVAPVTWVAFSPDGTRLASTSQDGTARIWDAAAGRELGVLTGHDSVVRSVAFSTDGRTVATAGEDSTVRLWRADRFQQIARLDAHTERVVSVAFSPDGRTLASGSDDDTAMLWKMPGSGTDQIDMTTAQAQVCEVVDRPISTAEWRAYFPGVDYRPPC